MKAWQIMTAVVGLSMVKKGDIFFYHTDKGIFNCTVSVMCGDKEREVFALLRELPKPERMEWTSFRSSDFTCVTMRFGNYRCGIVDVNIFIDDIQ